MAAPSMPDVSRHDVPFERGRPRPLGVEARFAWGDQLISAFFLKPGGERPLSIGSARGVDVAIGDGPIGTPRLDLLESTARGFRLRWTPRMAGSLERNGEHIALRDLLDRPEVEDDDGCCTLLLEPGDVVEIALGGLSARLAFAPLPRLSPWSLDAAIDYAWLNCLSVSMFLFGLFVAAVSNSNLEGTFSDEDGMGVSARLAKFLVPAPLPPSAAGQPTKHHGLRDPEEGVRGTRPNNPLPASVRHRSSSRDRARAFAQRLFTGSGALGAALSDDGTGAWRLASSALKGRTADASLGFDGLGLRGTGSGGPGSPVAIGAIGALVTHRGAPDDHGTIGKHAELGPDIAVDPDGAVIRCGSSANADCPDRELIRRVIHDHRSQIRYCYEQALSRVPSLAGKVTVSFVVAASGAVISSSVAQSTVSDLELESCIAGRARTWIFPRPKGVGAVSVSYPFVLKPSGE